MTRMSDSDDHQPGIGRDDPITLEEACRIVFRDTIKPATLRAEVARGNLIIERIGRRRSEGGARHIEGHASSRVHEHVGAIGIRHEVGAASGRHRVRRLLLVSRARAARR